MATRGVEGWQSPNNFFCEKKPKASYKTYKGKIPPAVPEGVKHPNRTDLRTTIQDNRTTTVQCICGKSYKNERGILQSRMRCLKAEETDDDTSCRSYNFWLWKALIIIWRRGKIGQPWRYQEEVYIPKEEKSENINQFRVISLLIREEFLVARTWELLQYSGSRDSKISGAGIVARTGRKWRAAEAVEQTETQLKHKANLEAVAQGRAGLKSLAATWYDLASRRERQSLVQKEVFASVEEERTSRAVAMRQQGAWMKWEQTMEWNVTWKDIWTWNPLRIRFLIQGVYDILPSPSNLYIGDRVETPAYPLCFKPRTLEHILSSCSKALGEDRYLWRHNQVLNLKLRQSARGSRTADTAKPHPGSFSSSRKDKGQKEQQRAVLLGCSPRPETG
nr:uncharacterized protein LOC103909868 [Danio rerio]|eukprot:XP_021326229.1 uncharacterized protein LOC103909868 [Danio rerio]